MNDQVLKLIKPANEAFCLNFYRPGVKNPLKKPLLQDPFHPASTYSIYEDEVIIGHKDLSIDLLFRSTDLSRYMNIKSSGQRTIGDKEPTDIKGQLKAFSRDFVFPEDLPKDTTDPEWRPPGKLVHRYDYKDRNYEIWQSPLTDPRSKQIFRNAQIFIPFFIEGGTCQDLDDPDWTLERWKLFLIYEVTPQPDAITPYAFVGFGTAYRFWVIPTYPLMKAYGKLPKSESEADRDPENASEKEIRLSVEHSSSMPPSNWTPPKDATLSRERISQFVVLPPYQGQSHGTHLYNTMMHHFLLDPSCIEISVEDPNESFDDLRDWCDLIKLREDPDFTKLSLPESIPKPLLQRDKLVPINSIIPQRLLNAIRRRHKLSPRQFARLTEMQLLDALPPNKTICAQVIKKAMAKDINSRQYYFWRMLVKERIYERNFDVMMQLESPERIEKVTESMLSVQDEYRRLLRQMPWRTKMARIAKFGKEKEITLGEIRQKRAMRRQLDSEDDDDGDSEDIVVAGVNTDKGAQSAKRKLENEEGGTAGRVAAKKPKTVKDAES